MEGDEVELGDAIYTAFIPPEWEEHIIRVTATPSQQLAQEVQEVREG